MNDDNHQKSIIFYLKNKFLQVKVLVITTILFYFCKVEFDAAKAEQFSFSRKKLEEQDKS